MSRLLELTRLGYTENYDGPWLPPLGPDQCRFMELKSGKRIGGLFVWWCTRKKHATGEHQLSCRTYS